MDKLPQAQSELRERETLAAADSPVHRLHPICKLSVTLLYIVIVVSFPKYVMDVAPSEMKNESKCFIESRHDQSVLTCVAYSFRNKLDISIKWQHSEYRDRNGQAVFNARISDMGRRSSMYGYESRLRSLLKRIVITPYRELRTKFFIKINRFL